MGEEIANFSSQYLTAGSEKINNESSPLENGVEMICGGDVRKMENLRAGEDVVAGIVRTIDSVLSPEDDHKVDAIGPNEGADDLFAAGRINSGSISNLENAEINVGCNVQGDNFSTECIDFVHSEDTPSENFDMVSEVASAQTSDDVSFSNEE